MSVRTDIVRVAVEKPFDPQRFRETSTEDLEFSAPHLGINVQGRDAVIQAIESFLEQAQPTWRLERDPVEHGNFVVAFVEATLSGGERRRLCYVYRFAGEKLSGMSTMRE